MADRQPRVLLLHPGSLYGGDWPGIVTLKGALVGLYSYLRAHDVEVAVVDLQVEMGNPPPDGVQTFVERGMESILRHEFNVLGISCWSSLEYLAAVEFAERVRAARPDCLVVVGGYHPSAVPGDFTFAGSPFDIVITGEGEVALLELVRAAGSGGRAQTRLIEGTPLPLERPFFDLDGYPYLTARPFAVGVYLSRGCPYRCTFCMEVGKGRAAWRHHSVEDALELVRRARSYNPQSIVFHDACFAYLDSWRREFLRGLVDMGIDVPLWAELRADRLLPEDLEVIAELDFYLTFGVETMSPRMATIMHKAADGEKYVREVGATLEEVNRRRILAKAYLIFNHPGETRETAEETVGYFERFVADHDTLTLIANMWEFRLYPGTDTAVRRTYYQETYGTDFPHPEWWKERRPQLDLAVARRDDRALEGYIERIHALHTQILRKMPAATQLHYLSHIKQLS